MIRNPWTAAPRVIRRGGLVLLGAHLALLGALLVSVTNGRLRFPAYRVDLEVYRLGSAVLLHGGALYGTLLPTQDGQQLPFTYPPFAAILLAPLAMVPYWYACLAMTVLTLALLAAVLLLVLRSLGALPARPLRWPVFGGLLLMAELIEPVRTAVYAGQVDVVLMALVVLDVLVDAPRWPRGALIGLAAAVKLTPAVFVIFLLVRGDRRAALTTVLSFVAATGIGFLLAGADSVRYWTGLVFHDAGIDNTGYAGNQSLLGVLTRFGLPATGRTGLWLALVAGTVVVTVWGMRKALAAGHDTVALSLNAVCGLLVSPISWSHHWVWMVVALPAWAILGWRTRQRLPLAVAAVGVLLFLVAPQWWWPRSGTAEPHWNLAAQLTGNCYVYFGISLLVVAAFSAQRAPLPAGLAGRRASVGRLLRLRRLRLR
jgi:alpha-1,2-mannosyltransferase